MSFEHVSYLCILYLLRSSVDHDWSRGGGCCVLALLGSIALTSFVIVYFGYVIHCHHVIYVTM